MFRIDISHVKELIILGFMLGVFGQGARVIVGLKKKYDRNPSNRFDRDRLLFSLFIGGVAGALGAITLLGEEFGKRTAVALITFGYAGTDFIEGFIKGRDPSQRKIAFGTGLSVGTVNLLLKRVVRRGPTRGIARKPDFKAKRIFPGGEVRFHRMRALSLGSGGCLC